MCIKKTFRTIFFSKIFILLILIFTIFREEIANEFDERFIERAGVRAEITIRDHSVNVMQNFDFTLDEVEGDGNRLELLDESFRDLIGDEVSFYLISKLCSKNFDFKDVQNYVISKFYIVKKSCHFFKKKTDEKMPKRRIFYILIALLIARRKQNSLITLIQKIRTFYPPKGHDLLITNRSKRNFPCI